VQLHHDKLNGKPSTIIKLTQDAQVTVIRKWDNLKIWRFEFSKILIAAPIAPAVAPKSREASFYEALAE
jgi:hypothetical protein